MTAEYSKFGPIVEALGKVLKSPSVQAGMGAAIPMAAGAGVAGGTSLVNQIRDTRAKARSYKEMMQLHPRLRGADQKKVKRYFGTLSRFNPTMAKDPTVSGAWISNIIDNETELDEMSGGQALLSGVKDLAGIRAQLSTAISKEQPRTSFGQRAERVVERGIEGGLAKRLAEAQARNKAMAGEVADWIQDKNDISAFNRGVRQRMG